MTEEYSAADKAALIPEDKWNTALDVLQTLYMAAREKIRADKINAGMITHLLSVEHHMLYQRDTNHEPTVIEPPAGSRIYRRPSPEMSWHLWDNPGEMPLPDAPIKGVKIPDYATGKPENPFADLAKYWEKEE